MTPLRILSPVLVAILASLPGLAVRLVHSELSPPVLTLVCGVAILAASFILLWACDTAQKDISQTLALAVVALIAVLPEYAVDMYFTWQAGKFPQSDYPHYAIANMTGANRLLIGVAWSVIVGHPLAQDPHQPASGEGQEDRGAVFGPVHGLRLPDPSQGLPGVVRRPGLRGHLLLVHPHRGGAPLRRVRTGRPGQAPGRPAHGQAPNGGAGHVRLCGRGDPGRRRTLQRGAGGLGRSSTASTSSCWCSGWPPSPRRLRNSPWP